MVVMGHTFNQANYKSRLHHHHTTSAKPLQVLDHVHAATGVVTEVLASSLMMCGAEVYCCTPVCTAETKSLAGQMDHNMGCIKRLQTLNPVHMVLLENRRKPHSCPWNYSILGNRTPVLWKNGTPALGNNGTSANRTHGTPF
eukprot:TRINITY_DN9601_c1_g1_i1.p1 TRINITY_DN9601_c1_g1~~TRINITY_DN9601_c1_g1_i1.p1  ORF type:complete len:142 (-),score=3.03 TRINITY_DN9601_c1_g1_i1:61-486(-)